MMIFLMLWTLGKLGSLHFDYIVYEIRRLLQTVVEEHAKNRLVVTTFILTSEEMDF